jgi:hypothetical protein
MLFAIIEQRVDGRLKLLDSQFSGGRAAVRPLKAI